ncbi:hypothetical protein I6A60_00485 [Frankia sp. AgB1.9]|uniref:hypothetical protein n=1 Tax=unclassified Frankia TaxID=2632575 RepID=UPI001931DE89|nr:MULTISPECIES: hypothetical protein [unclassified Frankia]MBL7487357.1 hypothetical protein [Frankia sp. AgW1.1]MBL7546365.1 hypothetical protein [Frankia sp. AgB1.9]MBL7618590.1 hypothetical protein [Frankia sp. AgB1.8]
MRQTLTRRPSLNVDLWVPRPEDLATARPMIHADGIGATYAAFGLALVGLPGRVADSLATDQRFAAAADLRLMIALDQVAAQRRAALILAQTGPCTWTGALA